MADKLLPFTGAHGGLESKHWNAYTVFYYDVFCALFMGLLHKDIAVDLAGHSCRSRYWVIGTARPGMARVRPLTRWWIAFGMFWKRARIWLQGAGGTSSICWAQAHIALRWTSCGSQMDTQLL